MGDIPVRVGDSVTRSTVLTTIDQNAGLEVYINVPVQEAADLKVGLPVHLVDDDGKRSPPSASPSSRPRWTRPRSRCWPRLAAALAGGVPHGAVRARAGRLDQAPALTVPIVALNRINGQFFAYVAEPGEGGATVARQRAIEPGPMVGNDYVVKSGLKAGEKLIVSGVQKIRDGAPVKARRPRPPPADPPAPAGEGKDG